MRRAASLVFGIIAVVSTLSLGSFAQEFSGTVQTVPNPHAQPLITAQVDNTKLIELKPFEIPAGAKDLGRMDGSKAISLELALKRTQLLQSAVSSLRGAVQDPSSPMYGKTLTPTEFAQNFGLAGADLDTITSWLKQQGFEVGVVDNGRMFVGFSGTVSQVETAFHTELHNYKAADGSQHFAPTGALEIPKALSAAVAGVKGTENFRPYAGRSFNAPVTDFVPGTMGEMASVEATGKTTPSLDGELLHDSSFTAGSYAIGTGGHTTLNVRLGGNNHPATGSLSIVDELTGATVAHIADITTCLSYNGGYGRSCSIEYAPAGASTGYLKAIYSGNEHERGETIGDIIISHAGSQTDEAVTTITSATSTYMWYSGSTGPTLTSIVAYAGGAGSAAPTPGGTYVMYGYDVGDDQFTLTSSTALSGCTQSTVNHTMTCTNSYTGSTLASKSDYYTSYEFEVSYSGDTNYAAATGYTYGYFATGAGAAMTSVTIAGSFTTTHTYGAAATDSGVTGMTLNGTSGYDPGYYSSNTGLCGSVDDFVGSLQIGNLGTYLNGCTSKTSASCTLSFTEPAFTIPALVTPGTYTVNAVYSGDRESSSTTCVYSPLASATGVTLTENKQTPTATMTTPTAASPVTQTYGTTTAFTVTGKLAWTGSGVAPTPGNVSFTSTAGGSFGTVTCAAANSSTTFPTSPYTCSATYTPSGTAGVGSYNINLSFATDTNYGATASTVTGNYVITGATPTVSLSNVSAPYGSTAPQSITVTATGDNGATATFGTAGGVGGSFSPPSCVIASNTCSVSYIPSGTLAIGTYTNDLTVSVAAYGNYSAGSATSTLTITADMTTLTLTADTPGSTSGGVTQVNLTATMSPAITGVTVTFTDSTTGSTYQAQTNGSGAATVLITTSTTGVSGGLNSFVASVPAGSTYTAATSNTQNVYLQGVLLSSAAPHDFSVCYTNGGSGPGVVGCGQATYPADSVGTVAGSPLCNGSNGTNGYTCTTGYAVTVLNFTPNNETVSIDLINSNQGTNAFSYQTNCPATLQPYGTTTVVNGNTVYEDRCTVAFYYLPPYGDGSSTTAGRYEAGSWSLSGNAGTLLGIGDPAFDRSGSVTFPETLSGFAVLPASNPVSVTPMSLTFGPQASGALSATQNIVVMNNGSTSIGLTFTPPTPSQFIVTNGCPNQLAAGASCSIGVAFQSSTSGTITGTLVITPAGASPITVNLSGTVASAPGYYLNSSGHNFGNISDGTTVTSGFTVTNNSGAPANFTIMPSGSSEFSITSNTCASQLAAGSSCSISVTFAPTAPGAASYSITMSTVTGAYQFYPGGTIQATVTFTGTGVAGGKVMVGTSTHNFGDVQIGSTGTNYGVTLTNTTGAAVTLTYSSLSGTEFAVVQSQTNCGGTLANNASCQMAFSFTPTASGFTSQLYSINVNGASDQVYSNAAGTYVNGITLEGTGTSTP